MSIVTRDVLIARNPSTGAELGRVEATSPEAVAAAVDRARRAQAAWGTLAPALRMSLLRDWAALLASEADAWADAIRDEVGKPRGEAMAEVAMGLDAIRWTLKHGERALADDSLASGWKRFLPIRSGRVRFRPYGVIGMLGTWNYPFFLNAPAIAQALAAGNAVVWKPSELAPLAGKRLQDSLERAGFHDGLVAAVHGGPDVGRSLVGSPLDKGMFTGGVESGRRVLGALASRGIPAIAELSGFDPAIVLPDAPRGPTLRALTWGAFVGSGQACVTVKRIYVVGDPEPWLEGLVASARALRVGDPSASAVDLGPLISEEARDRVHRTISATIEAGAVARTGGEPLPGPGWFYPPTVLAAESPRPESVLAGVFGPVVLVRGVPDVDSAVAATNASDYGLSASVWGRDLRAARSVALRIASGVVSVNDAVVPVGNASAPFGGTKASGYGRTHGLHGIREFVQPQVEVVRRTGGFRPQLFPYTGRLERLLRLYLRLLHPRS